MNFTIQSLKIFRTLQKIVKLHLIPSYFNPFILIKSSVTATNLIFKKQITKNAKQKLAVCKNVIYVFYIHCLWRPFSKNLIVLQSEKGEIPKKSNKIEIPNWPKNWKCYERFNENEITLPYLPVGSTSMNSESSESREITPFISCIYNLIFFSLYFFFLLKEREKKLMRLLIQNKNQKPTKIY